ncbi:MAG TPA: hypothetical protein VHZ09_13215 [Acidobacteriaceae bacterium]|jgi:hypothetical protein|nr:hypothetical protein [Acidobacteriaceae bacterium]
MSNQDRVPISLYAPRQKNPASAAPVEQKTSLSEAGSLSAQPGTERNPVKRPPNRELDDLFWGASAHGE